MTTPDSEQLKHLIQKIWGKVVSPKKRKKGEVEDPNQLNLGLNLPPEQPSTPDVKSLKRIQPLIPGLTTKEKRKKYLSDFSKPPFFTDTRKWLDANFEGNIYVGPDLSEYGFKLGGDQKIKPWEKVKYSYIFMTDMEKHMRSWNFAMARKLGLID
jgi:hypothetical protein